MKIHFLVLVLLLQTLVGEAAAEAVAAKFDVGPIRFEKGESFDRIIVETSGRVEPRLFTLREPDRLIMDFPDSRLVQEIALISGEGERVKQVRFSQLSYKPAVVRVVVDILKLADHQIAAEEKRVTLKIGRLEETAPTQEVKTPVPPPVTEGAIKLPDLSKIKNLKIAIAGEVVAGKPFFTKKQPYLSAKELFAHLKIGITFDSKEKVLRTLPGEKITLELKVGSPKIKINDEGQDIKSPPVIEGERLLVPLIPILRLLGYGFYFDPSTSTLVVNARILDFSFQVIEPVPQVVIQSTHLPAVSKVKELTDPPRLVIDLPDQQLAIGDREVLVSREGIRKIFIAQVDPGLVRVLIERGEMMPYHLTWAEENNQLKVLFPPAVQAINAAVEDHAVNINIALTKAIPTFEARSFTEPDRLVIDLPHTLYRTDALSQIDKGAVIRIRGSQFQIQPLTSRIVIDLAQAAVYRTELSPDRREIKVIVIPPAAIVAVKERRLVAALKGKVIVVDPGHGGADPGALSFSGQAEKTLTLPTALKLASLLSDAGATVLMTREEDTNVPLKQIAEFANNNRAELFISVHFNAFEKAKMMGTETYYFNPISKKFAAAVHKNMVAALGRADRKLRQVQFYVVNHTVMPSVLIEPVYLTNREEELLARDPAFQQKIAEGVFQGVVEYLEGD